MHQAGNDFEPKAAHPTPGSADLCFITKTSLEDVISHLVSKGYAIELGPVERTGAVAGCVRFTSATRIPTSLKSASMSN
jgi:hypothetical protein